MSTQSRDILYNLQERLVKEAKGSPMSVAGQELAGLALQRQIVCMTCGTGLRKAHMGMGPAQLQALKRVVKIQELPMYLLDQVKDLFALSRRSSAGHAVPAQGRQQSLQYVIEAQELQTFWVSIESSLKHLAGA